MKVTEVKRDGRAMRQYYECPQGHQFIAMAPGGGSVEVNYCPLCSGIVSPDEIRREVG